jgi:quinol monooxygenase YgiN
MATQDKCCTLVPYFKVNEGKLGEFKGLCEEFVTRTRTEPKCLHYGFSFDGDTAHCREGYADAAGLLAHLQNVDEVLKRALQISSITRLEIHGPAEEIDQLRGPLAALKPQFFALEYGFRN